MPRDLLTHSRIGLLTVLAAASTLGLSAPALAHAHLVSAAPAAGATVATAPEELDLTFSEALDLSFTGVRITGPGKTPVKPGDAMLMDDDKGYMVALPAGLPAGTYTVDWHALSKDGHKTHGSYSFTVKP